MNSNSTQWTWTALFALFARFLGLPSHNLLFSTPLSIGAEKIHHLDKVDVLLPFSPFIGQLFTGKTFFSMKKLFTLFFISLALVIQAQSITIYQPGCFSNTVLNKVGTTAINGTTRNTYEGGNPVIRVIYTSTGGGRWEIQLDVFTWLTCYYNTTASAPLAPALGLGTWVSTGAVNGCNNLSTFSGTGTTCTPVATATNNMTWTGTASTDWNNPCNWSPNGIPTATNTVQINDVANDPVIMSGTTAIAKEMYVDANVRLTVNSGGT